MFHTSTRKKRGGRDGDRGDREKKTGDGRDHRTRERDAVRGRVVGRQKQERTYERTKKTPHRIVERTDDEYDSLWFFPDFRLHGEPSHVERWRVGFGPFGDHVVA